jgi:hypothetical protein
MAKPSDGTARAAAYIPIQTLKWSHFLQTRFFFAWHSVPLTLQRDAKAAAFSPRGSIVSRNACELVNAFNKSDYQHPAALVKLLQSERMLAAERAWSSGSPPF